jgi:ribosome biogenesis ATPase
VRKIIDDQGESDRIRLSVPAIYDTIKRSNFSLNRKPKRILEDSIERVVEVVKSDVLGEDEEDSVKGDFEGLEEQAQPVPVRDIISLHACISDDRRNPTASIGAL